MTASVAPRPVFSLASTPLLSSMILVAGNLILAHSGQRFAIITACLALLLTLRAIRTLSTRLSDAGVTQLSWRGRVHLSWADVTQVTRTPRSLTLTGDRQQVVVSVEEFPDTPTAISYIEAHLPSTLSSRSESPLR